MTEQHTNASNELSHDHIYLGANHDRNAKRTWFVILLTVTMMMIEIIAGTIYGSMALVADGWHMSTHAAALLIAALAYLFARRHAKNPRFSFGTGNLGDLAGFASAIGLALVSILIASESVIRLVNPVDIGFSQAITVAVLGLAVNLLSAWLLKEDHSHHHHGHHSHDVLDEGEHDDEHHHDHDDQNLRAAYLHVLADALTSVLAIIALTVGSLFGWIWLDPFMGIVGAVVISRWSWSLMRDTGATLLCVRPEHDHTAHRIRDALQSHVQEITDLHVWQVGPGHLSAIIAISADTPNTTEHYRDLLSDIGRLSHVTIEVNGSP